MFLCLALIGICLNLILCLCLTLRFLRRLFVVLIPACLLLFCRISMTRVFDIQELGRVEFFTMLCSNSKGALCSFRAAIRDGRDIMNINIEKSEEVELGTVTAEFRQFVHYLTAYAFGGAYSVADLNAVASDSLF